MTTLTIGYGNPLRGDDGLGPFVAEAIRRRKGQGVRVVVAQQLLPELAEELAAADSAVFVDACASGQDVEVREMAVGGGGPAACTHAANPASLLALAAALYGRAPRAWIVSIRGERFDLGEGLSPPARRNAELALTRIAELLAGLSTAGRRDFERRAGEEL